MTDEEYIEMKAEEAREEARDVIKNHLKPYAWLDDYFRPENMTRAEFNKIKEEVEDKNGTMASDI